MEQRRLPLLYLRMGVLGRFPYGMLPLPLYCRLKTSL